jgi:hypothetical protein
VQEVSFRTEQFEVIGKLFGWLLKNRYSIEYQVYCWMEVSMVNNG